MAPPKNEGTGKKHSSQKQAVISGKVSKPPGSKTAVSLKGKITMKKTGTKKKGMKKGLPRGVTLKPSKSAQATEQSELQISIVCRGQELRAPLWSVYPDHFPVLEAHLDEFLEEQSSKSRPRVPQLDLSPYDPSAVDWVLVFLQRQSDSYHGAAGPSVDLTFQIFELALNFDITRVIDQVTQFIMYQLDLQYQFDQKLLTNYQNGKKDVTKEIEHSEAGWKSLVKCLFKPVSGAKVMPALEQLQKRAIRNLTTIVGLLLNHTIDDTKGKGKSKGKANKDADAPLGVFLAKRYPDLAVKLLAYVTGNHHDDDTEDVDLDEDVDLSE